MKFCTEASERVNAYMVHVPQQVSTFSGNITGQQVLDVGCGDMVPDFGLLSLGVAHISGLDVVPDWDPIAAGAQQVQSAGFTLPSDYRSRLSYTAYSGTQFPFPDDHFDFVFSWSAFEHIPNVPEALREIRRVVKPLGQVFIQVYPWFHSLAGSHLSDYIPEPFFHLTRSPEWVHQKLTEYVELHPDKSSFVLHHMWPEYGRLNGYSARRFIIDVLDAGFCLDKVESIINDEKLSSAPAGVAVADLVTAGSKLLLRPGKPFIEEERAVSELRREKLILEAELAEERGRLKNIQRSHSWRLTAPLRALMQALHDFRHSIQVDRSTRYKSRR